MDRLIADHGGRIANTAGDSVLAEFPSAVDAVQCAVTVQEAITQATQDTPEGSRLQFRIGVHVGDVMVRGGDLLGDGVNIAARLEGLADPGGVCISEATYSYVRKTLPLAFTDLGLQTVKNIEEPVRAYAMKAISPAAHGMAETKPLPVPDRPSIAALPFTNMSPDPEQEFFADGMTEDIITGLSRLRWLFVIARNSTFTYKGKAVDVRQVARELGVRYVLEGSVRASGKRIRVTGQLIDAETGKHIWAEKYDRLLEDVFAVQDEITEGVLAAIEPNLRSAEIERAQRKSSENLQAYDLYLRALSELYPLTEESYRRAERYLRSAVELDPDYSDAWAGLADCLCWLSVNGWNENWEQDNQDACSAGNRAVSSDPENGIALSTYAFALAVLSGEFDEALELAERALRVQPNSVHVRNYCGWVFIYNGEAERAIAQFETARRQNPLDPRAYVTHMGLAAATFFARRFNESIRWSRRALLDAPSSHPARRYLAAALAHLGQSDEAKRVVEDLLVLQPNSTLTRARTNPFIHSWMADLYVGGLALAGLPD
jgi:adenylate cyclase